MPRASSFWPWQNPSNKLPARRKIKFHLGATSQWPSFISVQCIPIIFQQLLERFFAKNIFALKILGLKFTEDTFQKKTSKAEKVVHEGQLKCQWSHSLTAAFSKNLTWQQIFSFTCDKKLLRRKRYKDLKITRSITFQPGQARFLSSCWSLFVSSNGRCGRKMVWK